MNTHPHQGATVYHKNQKEHPNTANNSRDIDARALLACARRLDDAKTLMTENAKSKRHQETLGEALRRNQQIWTIFQMSICDPENPLPQELKAILMSLSRYIDKTSFQIAAQYDVVLIDSLININRMIAAGLSKQPSGESLTPPPVDTRNIPTSLMTSA